MVPLSEISDPKNDFNLNLPRYIDSTEPEDLQDIDAHLRGGIPNRDIDALEAPWKVFPTLRANLFKPNGRPAYSDLKIPTSEIEGAILGRPEFAAFKKTVSILFEEWKTTNNPKIKGIAIGDRAKLRIEDLSESLLVTFRKAPLLNPYDIYQHLLDYWSESMQDDVYLLTQEGWKAAIDGKPNSDLIPRSLIIAHYFANGQKAVEQLEAERDAISQLEEMDEEQGGEDGLLSEAQNEKGKLTAKSIKERLNEIKGEKEAADEQKAIRMNGDPRSE